MPAFDIVVVGCGGGPDEHNLSSYLLKASQSSWTDGIVAVEAGSGIGALTHILQSTPDLFGEREHVNGSDPISYTSAEVLSWIRCYLITHAHMDHINSLVLCAGSLAGEARSIYATHQTLKDIEQVFSDRLWPNLASWENDDEAMLVYKRLHMDGQYKQISDGVSVRTLPLCHGQTRSGQVYESTAFFIRNDASNKELLFFGDVEPDSVSKREENHDIWRVAAAKIPQTLSAIFIECSYPSGRPDDRLYGHMSPDHLVRELVTLAEEVVKVQKMQKTLGEPARKKQRLTADSAHERRNALSGVKVYITHCKDNLAHRRDKPIHQVIAGQVKELAQEERLGVEIIGVEQGMLIHVY
ncbi:cyclic-AMP phosphodiesterase [Cytidiella melzeri]|nr:cyclic-AMP phosphodiesterase [Cytidiella melzeri]